MRAALLLIAIPGLFPLSGSSDLSLVGEAKRAFLQYEAVHAVFARYGPMHVNRDTRTVCGTVFYRGDGVMNGSPGTEFVFVYDPAVAKNWNPERDRGDVRDGVIIDWRTPHFPEKNIRQWHSMCPVGLRQR
jgi:hypothetical protein